MSPDTRNLPPVIHGSANIPSTENDLEKTDTKPTEPTLNSVTKTPIRTPADETNIVIPQTIHPFE